MQKRYEPIGKISKYAYLGMPLSWQHKVDRAEKYAESKYEEHKRNNSKLYSEALFEIWHNYCYTQISNEEYEDIVKREFVYRYTEKMVWLDYHDGKLKK